jgi:hypothetical protein
MDRGVMNGSLLVPVAGISSPDPGGLRTHYDGDAKRDVYNYMKLGEHALQSVRFHFKNEVYVETLRGDGLSE